MRQGLRARTKGWVAFTLGLLLLSGCLGTSNQATTPGSDGGTQGASGFVAPPIAGMGTVTGVVPAATIPRVASGTAARITSQQGGLWLTPDAVLAAVQADARARKAGDTLQPPITRAQQIPVNPSGQYNLSVPGGTGYELVYIDASGRGVQIGNINVPVGQTKQVDVANTQLQPTGTVTLTVVDRSTAQPLNNATVTLINTGTQILSDATGVAEIQNLPAGHYAVTVAQTGYLSRYVYFQVASGQTTNLQNIELGTDKGGASGQVQALGLSSLENIVVYAKGTDGSVTSTLTTSAGIFQFPALAVGQGYSFVASAEGFGTAKIDGINIAKGSTAAVPTLALVRQVSLSKGAISGFARFGERLGSLDHAGILVSVEGSDLAAVTARDGSFVLNDVPVGTQTINFTDANHATLTRTVAIQGGSTVKLTEVNLAAVTGSIAGSVTGAGGAPLAGVAVSDDLGNATVTDPTGTFTLPSIPVGDRVVTLQIAGYLPTTLAVAVTSGAATPIAAAAVAMSPMTLSGTVLLSTGATDHSGTTVTLQGGTLAANLTTTTDAAGAFTLFGVGPGSYQILCTRPGFLGKTTPVAVLGQSANYQVPFSISMDPAIGVVKGRVVLPNAPDNSGVTVALGGQTTTTDVVGQWYLNLPEGSYTGGINYTHPDYVGQSDAAAVTVAAATPVDRGTVTLTRNTGSISGVVNDGAAVLAGVSVTDDLGNTTVTNAAGSFTLATVPVGSRTLTAIKSGFTVGTANVTVTAGTTANLSTTPIALTALQLTGTVNLGGSTNHSGVTLTLAGPGGINLTTTSNTAGQYTFTGVSDGSYQIQASKTGFTTKQLPVAVVGNTGSYAIPFALTLDPAIGVVKGRVVLPNAPDNSGVTVALGGQTTTTDVVGQWYLNLPEGSYTGGINYTHPDYVGQSDTAAVTVSTLTPVDKGTVTLTRNTGSITGTVTDGTVALAGVAVTDDLGHTTVSNASGVFTLATVPVGIRTLTALKGGFTVGTATTTVTAGATANLGATPIALAALQLSGTVNLAGSANHSGVALTLAGPGGINLTTTSSATGAFTFTGVPDGSYQIQASKTGFTTKQLPVAVVGNTGSYAIPFALTLDPAIGVVKGRVVLPNAPDNSGVTVALGGQTTTTDVVGQWYLNLPEGSYGSGINYTHPDYVGQSDTAAVTVSTLTPVDKGTVTLTRNTGSITGLVTDGATPLVGASVTDDLGNTTVTNATGAFTLATVAVGTRPLSVLKTGFTVGLANATVTAGATANLNATPIVLTQRTLTGSVTATTGGGIIAGASVSIAGGASATSNAAGQYTLAGIDPGTYLLWFSAPGYVSRSMAVTIPDQAATTAPTAAMDTAYGTLQGRVALSKGSAADYGLVTVTVKDGAGATTLATATPDATGVWGVNVQTGTGIQVVVGHADYASASKTGLNVAVGQVTDSGLLTLTRNTGTITGTVVDGGAAPLVGATLIDDLGNQATSGAGGTFILTSEVGTRTLSVSLSGYTAPLSAPTATVTVGAATALGNITLSQRTLTGSVTATTGGAALSGVTVTVASSGATATTDVLGNYTFAGLNPGTYALSFAMTGYTTRNLTVVVPDQKVTTAPTLAMDTAYGTLQGRVGLSKGTAADYGLVTVTVKDGTGVTTLATVAPDATGAWAANVQAGSAYQIAVTHVDYAAGSKTGLTVATGQVTDTGLLTLTRNTGTITGVVQNGATPLAGVAVSDDLGNAATTNASGLFTLTSEVGARTLTAVLSGFGDGNAAAAVTAGATTNLSATPIQLTALALTGTVNLGGGAANHSGVSLTLSGGGGLNLTTTSTATGAFTFSGVIDGAYQLQASKAGYVTQTRTLTVVGNTGTFTAPGTIVLDPAIGAVMGRLVLPGAADNSGVLVSLGGQTTTTDPVGQWALNLPEGSYAGGLSYSHADYVGQTDTATIAVAAATPVDKGTVTLVAKAVSVSGTVSPATATVSDGLGHTATAVAGSFTVAGVPAGQRSLTVAAPGYLSQTVAVTVNVDAVSGLAVTTPAAINVALTQRALTGSVTMANGTTTAGVNVSLSGPAGTFTGAVTNGVGNLGTLSVAGIEPGNYNLTLSQAGFVTQTLPVSIVDGIASYALPGTLTLQAATGTLSGRVVLPNAVENGGVVVTATGPSGSVTTTTDPVGMWLLTLPEGNITSVQYGHADYVTQADPAVSPTTPAVISAATPVNLGAISLTAKAVSVSGTVTPASATISDGLGHTALATAGAFTVTGVPTGSRTLTISAPGYLSQSVAVNVSVDPTTGTTVTAPVPIAVTLQQRALIGTLSMADGSTTAAVSAVLSGSAGTYVGSVTNGVGNVGTLSVIGIEPGNYNLTLSQTGFVTQTVPVSIIDGIASYAVPGTLTLQAAKGTLSGYVVLLGQNDHSGVTVTASGVATTTDVSGYWQVDVQAGSVASVTFAKTGFVTANDTTGYLVAHAATTRAGIRTLLPATGSVAGTVVDDLGAPIANATLVVSTALGNATGLSAANGTFTVTGVPISTNATLTVAAGHHASATQTAIAVTSGATTTLATPIALSRLTLTGTATLVGAIDYSTISLQLLGTAIPNATINAVSGAFSFFGVGAGSYQLQVSAAGYLTQTVSVVILAEQNYALLSPINLVRNQGVLSGVVTKNGATDHSGILVTLTDTGGLTYTTVTNALGQWQKTLPASNYTRIDYAVTDYISVADAAGYNLSQGNQLTATTQALALNAGTVTVTTNDGVTNLGGVTVTVQNASHTYTATTATTGSGQAAITGVIAGTYTVSAQKLGYGNAQVANVVVTTAGVAQTLSLAINKLTGTLNLEEAVDHSGVTVSLEDLVGTVVGTTTPAVNGSFTLNGVTAGNYKLVLTPTSPDYQPRTINVTIVGNDGLVLVETLLLSKTNFAYDRDHLTFNSIRGQNSTIGAVRYNLNLPASLTRGTTVTWSSNQPGLVDSTGLVTLPLSSANPNVTLTATDGVTGTLIKTFVLTLVKDYLPAFALGSSSTLTLSEDFGFAFKTFAASNANGEAIVYAIIGNDNPTLFGQATIDAATGELKLVSASNANGIANLILTATTFDQSATLNLAVNVQAVADPVLASLVAPALVALGQAVTLDASATVDIDGNATYTWSVLAQPAGSAISLAAQTGQTPSFTPTISGTYTVGLTVANGAGSTAKSASIKVLPDLTVANVSVVEGTNAVFTINTGAHANDPITFDYATVDVTAKVDLDYQRTLGSITLAAGVNTTTITVPVTIDKKPEADETFLLRLSNLQGTFQSSVEAQATIAYEPLDLNTLNGVNGAKVPMTTAGYWNDRPIAGVGDVNGDGYDDFAVGESTFSNFQGRVFVVFGKPGLGVYGAVDVATLTPGSDYITLTHGAYGLFGAAVTGADLNHDGYSDIIVGAPYASVIGSYGGGIYVIYGSASPVDVNLAVATGVTKIGRTTANSYMANNLKVVGDVNGDGFPDLLIGKTNSSDRTYLLYGGNLSTTTPIDLDAIGGGGVVLSVAGSTSLGSDLSAAGDVNGDGYADFMIGENYATAAAGTYAGKVYLVYGSPTLPGTIDLTTSAGVTLSGAYYNWAGDSLSHGDLNGDGYSDLLIGGRYGSSYQGDVAAIWGGPNLTAMTAVNLATDVYGATGVRFVGDRGGSLSYFGQGMASPGDLNGDGYDDLVVGAPGSDTVASNVGEVFVFYGGAALPAVSYASTLNGANGYAITGQVLFPRVGTYVASAGDVNGDGYPDVFFGNDGRSVNYVVYGDNLTNQITHLVAANETAIGTTGKDVMKGAAGKETLIGNGGSDVITAGPGDDVIHVTGLNFTRVDGGSGLDRLVFDQNGAVLDLTSLTPERIRGIEIIDFGGTAANQIILNANTARWLNHQSERGLVILAAGTDDKISFGAENWTLSTAPPTTTPTGLIGNLATQYSMPQGANQFSLGNVSLWVDANVPTYPKLVVQDIAVNEDKGEVRVRVARDNGLYVSSVQYATADGTALAGTHYTAQSGTLTFYQGELVHEVIIPLVKDAKFETDKQFTLNLSAPSNAVVATATGTVTIHDNTIDLTQLDPTKVTTLDRSSGYYPVGYSVGAAGDLNGDGFEDFVVTGGYGAGYKADIVFGQANAAKTLTSVDLTTPDGTTAVAIDGLLSYGLTFSASHGDFNGDGYDDLLIGDPTYSVGGFGTNTYEGQVVVIYGKPHVSGISTIGTAGLLNVTTMTAADGVTFTGAVAQEKVGSSVAFAGDMNGDGRADIVTGTLYVTVGANANAGRANIIFGAAVPTSAVLSATNSLEILGTQNTGYFGSSVSSAGDVNGDGFDDVVIGAYRESTRGIAYIVDGASTLAPGAIPTVQTILPETTSLWFGVSVSGGGDLNGDGYGDIVIGSSYASPTINTTYYSSGGVVDVVYGSATFASMNLSTTPLNGTNGFTVQGSTLNGSPMHLGSMVAMLGDINGDGKDDIAMRPDLYTSGLDQVSMLYGGSVVGATLDVTQISPSQGFTIQGTFPDENLGSWIAGGTDWNGDGFGDLLLGASGYMIGNSNVGRAYLIYGNDFSGIQNYYGTSGNDGNSSGITGSAYYYLLQGNDIGNVVTAPDFIFGGQGDDKILINASGIDTVAFYSAGAPTGKYVGGRGLDSLEFYYGTGTVDFTAPNKLPNTFTGFEMINLRKIGEPTGINSNETIIINATRMRQMMDSDRHTFWIRGDVNDAAVVSGGPWTEIVLDGDPLYNTYTWNGGNLTLKVDTEMVVGGKLTLN